MQLKVDNLQLEIVLRADAIGGRRPRRRADPAYRQHAVGYDLRAVGAGSNIKARFPDKTQATVLAGAVDAPTTAWCT